MKYLRALGMFFATLGFYLGLPLLGWGLAPTGSGQFDLLGFFSALPRFLYSIAVAGFSLAVGWQAIDTPEGITGGSGRKEKRISRQAINGTILVGLLYAGIFLIPFFERRQILLMEDSPAAGWLGALLVSAGYALIFLSGLFLGRQYSAEVTVQENHQLITRGPYRFIRHPRYLGILLLTLGMALIFRSWLGLALLIPTLGLLLFRITDEEALMRQEFGGQWEDYCTHTWKLLPYLY